MNETVPSNIFKDALQNGLEAKILRLNNLFNISKLRTRTDHSRPPVLMFVAGSQQNQLNSDLPGSSANMKGYFMT